MTFGQIGQAHTMSEQQVPSLTVMGELCAQEREPGRGISVSAYK